MKVGIIVPFYKGHQYLDKLITSFAEAANGLSCTLYIIDNSPGSLPVSIAPSSQIAVEIIREKPGIGYGKACNTGFQLCKRAGFDYIIIANQDGYVSRNFIPALLAPFEKDNSILISAPLIKTYGNDQVEDFFIKYYLSQQPELVSDMFLGQPKDYYEMIRISGACFAFNMHHKLYTYPYFFDPLFHMYYEDEDLCHRAHMINAGIVLVCRDAIFYHQHAHTTDLENKEGIEADKLVSEKILRLKDTRKAAAKSLYGIFVTTSSSLTYHLLRGEFKQSYLHIRSFVIVLYRLSSILKSRKLDLSVINTSSQKKI